MRKRGCTFMGYIYICICICICIYIYAGHCRRVALQVLFFLRALQPYAILVLSWGPGPFFAISGGQVCMLFL